jgi:hypothetical protein
LADDGDPKVGDRCRREVLEVLGDQHVCAARDGRGQHVPVLGVVGHGADQLFVAGHPRVGEVGRHLAQAVLDGLLFRPGLTRLRRKLREKVLRPQRPVDAFLGDRQQVSHRYDFRSTHVSSSTASTPLLILRCPR